MRTIAHISDIHFGRIDLAIAAELTRTLTALKPNLLIVSGDLTQRARAGQFAAARAFLDRLPQPQLIVPGNHDVPLYDLLRRLISPTQLYRRYITRELRPVFSDDELLVAGINSARAFSPRWRGFWKDGRVSQKQLDWLRGVFASAKPGQIRILVSHHPFIPAPAGDQNDLIHGAPAALPQLSALGVDLMLAGHLHASYGGDVRTHHTGLAAPLLSIQAGTATSTRLRGCPNAFNIFRLEPGKISLEVNHWNGRTFAVQAMRQFTLGQDGWHEQL